MFKEIIKKAKFGNGEIIFKTGKIARQADSSVIVQMGDTIVLTTVCVADSPNKDKVDFLPLTVHYREMYYAAGKIPSGFIKREGKNSDYETLISRLIDRSIRPIFPDNFFTDIQIISTVFSYDPKYSPEILSMIGASVALEISDIPTNKTVASCKVGYINKNFVLNPSYQDLKDSELDLVISGDQNSVNMIELTSKELSDDDILKAIEFGQSSFSSMIEAIKDFKSEILNQKMILSNKEDHSDNINNIGQNNKEDLSFSELFIKDNFDAIRVIFKNKDKKLRNLNFKKLEVELCSRYSGKFGFDGDILKKKIGKELEDLRYSVMRNMILEENVRVDGRKPDEIREINCEVSLLPRAHGSALFTRGSTQALGTVTFGTANDEQVSDSLEKENRDRFFLHYTFLPYSVNEVFQLKAPSRREIGHGKLAANAINAIMPNKKDFAYTIRATSEITESDGSSSMATVCAVSMSLLSAGVPIKSNVAGIAMGLIKDKEKFVVLSDIMADEDYLGDMDFKVAGTKDGITALQMDIKIEGINNAIMKKAIKQARDGLDHIIDVMNKSVKNTHNLIDNAPKTHSLKISRDRIRELIGPGGRVIKELCETTGSKIDISEDGSISVFSQNQSKLDETIRKIEAIYGKQEKEELEIGKILDAEIIKIVASGVFVSSKNLKNDAFVHISEISLERVEDIKNYVTLGDKVKVKILGIDNKGRNRFSIKDAHQDLNNSEKPLGRMSINTRKSTAEIDEETEKKLDKSIKYFN